jgi:heat-inducible transcriptional repressor
MPTDLAYRYYVNLLPARPRLRDPERRLIIQFFDEALADVDEILRGTTHLLSRLTRYASLALAPSPRETAIVVAELIKLGTTTLLLVVFESGQVEKRAVEIPPDVTDEEIDRVSRAITETLRGAALPVARAAAAERAEAAGEPERTILRGVGEALDALERTEESEHVLLGGVANIAGQEVFQHRESLGRIFEALERESEVLRLLRDAAASPDVSVTIGRENPVTGMWEASVVAAPFGAQGGSVGTIGVVGPTRMDYGTAISAVRAVAERLSAVVEALGG